MNIKYFSLSLLFIFLCTVMSVHSNEKPAVNDGYPLSNFGITANASLDGSMFGEILQNTGKLGGWLIPRGKTEILIEKDGKTYPLSAFTKKKIEREFPFVKNEYSKAPFISAKITTRAFCPLGINDVETSSLPVLMLEIKITAKKMEEFNIIVKPDESILKEGNIGTVTIHSCKQAEKKGSEEKLFSSSEKIIPISIESPNEVKVYIAIALYDTEWYSAKKFSSAYEISHFALDNWEKLYLSTKDFSDKIPKTGDKKLNEYLRWYMVPGIALTRVNKNDEVLTMGYCELNQRDSYWTSWLHLVLYKDIERKMLAESVEYQQESGKIPTTILPLIERNDDLDINAFFILREARFYRFYKDKTVLAADWTAMKKAMDWLAGRDKSGRGLPEQVSFWGDWKDVLGVKERHYSPFSGLIFLAALKEMIFLADEQNDAISATKYRELYKKGYDFINQPVEQGGLWNGKYYCQIWKDGSVNDHLLQDQTIGILFGVVPQDKAEKIIRALNAQSLTKYGVAETTPYYPQEFGYEPATYHNGAVWPWLSFMDCWSRVVSGRKKEAVNIVKRTANADLVASGDYSPNEHINSLTGENLGFILQGWNAGLYGLVYFGLQHSELNITGK